MADESRHPRITVVTPSYNQASFLEQTITSVLDQGYPNLEYIVIDGGSSDGSVELLRRYQRHLSYWVSEPDDGQSCAINKGFARATGKLLGWLNSDDYLLPGALEKIARMYQEDPEAGVFVGGGELVDIRGAWLASKVPPEDLSLSSLLCWLDDFHFSQPSAFFTREAWLASGPLDLELHFAMDLDLWLRLAKRYRFARSEELLSAARMHQAAKTVRHANLSLVDSCLVLMRHGGEPQARRHLEEMAGRLSWNEHYVGLVRSHPLFRMLQGVVRKLLKSDQLWRDLSPRHSRQERLP